MKPYIFIFLFLYIAPCSAIEVSGELTGDQVWSVRESPVHVTATVRIPAGSSIKIEPGVTVIFDDYYALQVYGVIEATGTEKQPVLFTALRKVPDKPGWQGLVLYGEKCKAILSDCIIENSFKNMCWKTSPLIRSSTFRQNTYGFYCSNTKSAMIMKCKFTDNTYGIYCDFSTPTIQGNIIARNDFGIYCIFSSAPLVGLNILQDNTTKDIFLDDSMGKNEITVRNQYIWSLVRDIF